jgi:capsular polysaccharide biosynthesis protein
MTDVELPQLSLQRYFDLLKRRRWQLLPVSLVGLLVGGLVAFFIPRYYVAETLLEHQPLPGAPVDVRDEDPFRSLVDSARTTIPLAVQETLEALKMPEFLAADAYGRTQIVKEFEGRVLPQDRNSEKGRQYALINVSYRDRDGARAAPFLNTLVDVWMKKRIGELREQVLVAERAARQREIDLNSAYETSLADKADIERLHKIPPDLGPAVQMEQMRLREEARERRRTELDAKLAERDALEAQLARDTEALAATPARVPPDAATMDAMAKENPQAEALGKEILLARLGLAPWRENSGTRRRLERQLAGTEKLLQELLASGATEPDGLIANPKHAELQAAIAKATTALVPMRAAVARQQSELAVEDRQHEALVAAWKQFEGLRTKLASIEADRKAAQDARRAQEETLARLEAKLPIRQVREAFPPPAPTEPNIVVVALIGCVLGLGAAIALILLLDLVQGSFKTADDVERGLGVPVLGGISHLETEEERRHASRGRRRASLVAFGFVGLVVVVVTIYYVDPVRLPPAVRDILSMLLGS